MSAKNFGVNIGQNLTSSGDNLNSNLNSSDNNLNSSADDNLKTYPETKKLNEGAANMSYLI